MDTKQFVGLRCPHISTSVEDLISTVLAFSYIIWQEGKKVDALSYPITEELNEQLKDIPENQGTWKKIYQEVPDCFLKLTVRREIPDIHKYILVAFVDLTCEEAERLCKNVKFKWK